MKIMTREMSPIEQINRLKNNPAFAQYCKDKFYPESFRIDVVKLSLIPSIRVSTLSKELQIPMKIIYEWKNKYADSIKNQTTEKKEENVKWI
jgi:transposase-like protein